MDDSVIKVLRRNGSWAKSSSALNQKQSNIDTTKNSEEDFSLDKNFGILAAEIKKRMMLIVSMMITQLIFSFILNSLWQCF